MQAAERFDHVLTRAEVEGQAFPRTTSAPSARTGRGEVP